MTPASAPDVGVVIVAAGAGSRTGSAELKQFRWIAGKPMLLHSVETFLARPDVALVVAVLPKSHAGDPPPWLLQTDTDRMLVSVGGRERGDSVIAGLEDLDETIEIAVIHDAARPFVDDATIDRVIAQARRGTGAIAALPMTDTVKQTDDDRQIVATVERIGLWRAQTPQAFPRTMIEQAYVEGRKRGKLATDDAALCEAIGAPVVCVLGSERAIKVTREEDFAIAEAIHQSTGRSA